MLEGAKRASHIDPPASSYAIMRRARPYRGENSEPGKDVRGELEPRPGIREQPGSDSVIAVMSAARPLFPRKRTSIRDLAMSHSCQELTHAPQQERARRNAYSITSSAATSSVCGTERPSALAVLRLISSSNRVGCTPPVNPHTAPPPSPCWRTSASRPGGTAAGCCA